MGEGTLKDFIETASSVSPFRVEDDFGNGFVRLRSEEAERRQAAHDIRSTEDIVIEA
ncbi:MAG: ATP-binding protein, partial [Eggerthellaceae bacterium]